MLKQKQREKSFIPSAMADLSAKVEEALETDYLEFFENSFAKLERREWDLLWESAIETALNKDWLSLRKHSCRIEIKGIIPEHKNKIMCLQEKRN